MHSARCLAAVLTLLLAVFRPSTASAQETSAVLEEARDRHRAALEAIRTLTYSYESQTLKSEPFRSKSRSSGPADRGISSSETGPGQYWQSPDARRNRALWSDGATVDEVLRFGRLLRTKTPKAIDANGPEPRMEITLETRSNLERGWHFGMLFEHWNRDYGFVPFHGLLQQPHQLRRVERLPPTPDGKAGDIRVELEHDAGVYEFWFSPSHNYLIRKRVEYPIDLNSVAEPNDPHRLRLEQEVVEFVEPNPGQFFPARIDYRSFEGSVLRHHSRTILSTVQLNRPVPAEAFRIPGISGGWCADENLKAGFRVDADGYRVGKFQPTLIAADVIRPPAPPKTPPVGQTPTSLWVGLAIAVLVLCLCAALFEIRHLRAELKKRRLSD